MKILVILFLTIFAFNGHSYEIPSASEMSHRRVVATKIEMESYRDLTEIQKVESVNSYFNQFPYLKDINEWKMKNYWATPMEFITHGGGDSEDFAIVKMFHLIDLGVDSKKLLLGHGKQLPSNGEHIVLLYYNTPDSTPLVLDSCVNYVSPLDERNNLKIVYAFSGEYEINLVGVRKFNRFRVRYIMKSSMQELLGRMNYAENNTK